MSRSITERDNRPTPGLRPTSEIGDQSTSPDIPIALRIVRMVRLACWHGRSLHGKSAEKLIGLRPAELAEIEAGDNLDVDVITVNRQLQRTLHTRGRDYRRPIDLVWERLAKSAS